MFFICELTWLRAIHRSHNLMEEGGGGGAAWREPGYLRWHEWGEIEKHFAAFRNFFTLEMNKEAATTTERGRNRK